MGRRPKWYGTSSFLWTFSLLLKELIFIFISNWPGDQGGILSAHLYKIYIDELLNILKSKRLGLKIGTVFIGSPTCADDIALLASLAEELKLMCRKQLVVRVRIDIKFIRKKRVLLRTRILIKLVRGHLAKPLLCCLIVPFILELLSREKGIINECQWTD